MPKVFICYSSRDHAFAHKLAVELRRNNIEVWFDGLSLKIGDSLIQKISDAISEADYIFAVISNNSINSEWVNRELRLALTREFMGTGTKVLPVLLDKCEMPPFLLDKLYADFSDKDLFDISFDKLLDTLLPERNGSIFDDVEVSGTVINPALAVNAMFEELGMAELPFEKKQVLMVKMTEVILKRIYLETVERLEKDDQEKYVDLLDRNASAEEVESFLTSKIPDYHNIVQNVVNEFKAELKSDMGLTAL